MSDMMTFPETWEEFEKSCGFTDSEEVYTNGSRLIPSFRVKQWLDHIAQSETKRQATASSDLIDREDAIDAIQNVDWYHQNRNKDMVLGANSDEHQAWYKAEDIYKTLEELPSAKAGPCDFCIHNDDCEDMRIYCPAVGRQHG